MPATRTSLFDWKDVEIGDNDFMLPRSKDALGWFLVESLPTSRTPFPCPQSPKG